MEGRQPVEHARSRRKRGSLSREEIVSAAIALLDADGIAALTFARLGQELGASPTAVYRHFSSREDLVLALGDALDGESLEGYQPTDRWRDDLQELAWRAWRTALAHPAAAHLSLGHITNGINELRAVDAVLRALHMAGLRGRDAVLQYQVYAHLVVGAASSQGERLSTAADDTRRTPEGWIQVYAPTDPSRFPYAEALKAELRLVDYEQVFRKELEMYLDALATLVDDDARRARPDDDPGASRAS